MSQVKILPADVISRIAAGEVVERPASVVKELLENALDAGATRVELHLADGGKTLIHIKDNGCGIARDDLDALFTRHATSKIASSEDLDAILSLGFRGEALYSVGSVAEVTLKSRARDAAEAWELKVRGGIKESPVPAAMPSSGTDIRVGEIFFNTPARKKFLKSPAAEFEQVLNVVLPYALLYPQCSFLVTHNGRTSLDLAPAESPRARIAAALRLNADHIIAPDEFIIGDLKHAMFLGDINIQRPRRDLQYLFVNGRPVQSRNLSFHINETFKLIMPSSVHPFFMVMLTVPAENVDVNVHPAKREVRLHEEARIGGILRRTIERVLMTGTSAKGPASVVEREHDEFTFPAAKEPFIAEKTEGLSPEKLVFGPGQKGFSAEIVHGQTDASPVFSLEHREKPAQEASSLFEENPQGKKVPLSVKERLSAARFIGTFICKYHLFEVDEALFVIDQHAAQERILFERFCRQIESGKIEVQPLLTPLVFDATPQEMSALECSSEKLRTYGFEVEAFGPTALAIQAYPALITAPEAVVRLLLGEETLTRSDPEVVARRACRASVMAGDRMFSVEAEHQLRELLACADPFACPHGRPVFIELKSSFLDRQFLRS